MLIIPIKNEAGWSAHANEIEVSRSKYNNHGQKDLNRLLTNTMNEI
jgi:hypothetical protein